MHELTKTILDDLLNDYVNVTINRKATTIITVNGDNYNIDDSGLVVKKGMTLIPKDQGSYTQLVDKLEAAVQEHLDIVTRFESKSPEQDSIDDISIEVNEKILPKELVDHIKCQLNRHNPQVRVLGDVLLRGSNQAAGYDLIHTGDSCRLQPQETRLFDIGIKLEIPDGYVGLIMDRSSMGKRGIKVLGGVIDSDYRGSVGVLLCNVGTHTKDIMKGDKIAQILFVPVLCNMIAVSELTDTHRGEAGFGSTGV